MLPGSIDRRERARALMRTAAARLDDTQRVVVREVIAAHAAQRGWVVSALHVGATHVHVVVKAEGVPPERVMGEFKAWASRRLRESGTLERERPVWTTHGSTRHLFEVEDVLSAIDYVARLQDHPGRFAREAAERAQRERILRLDRAQRRARGHGRE